MRFLEKIAAGAFDGPGGHWEGTQSTLLLLNKN